MTVNTLLQGGLYTMGCLNVLSSVAGCFTLPLFKAGQLAQQWGASSSLWVGAGWWAARVIGRENSAIESSTCLFSKAVSANSPTNGVVKTKPD